MTAVDNKYLNLAVKLVFYRVFTPVPTIYLNLWAILYLYKLKPLILLVIDFKTQIQITKSKLLLIWIIGHSCQTQNQFNKVMIY